MRILLADDNAIARKALAAGLTVDGYDVDLADNGEVALEQARAHPPDFVISDVLMPKMDGYALCRAIREDEILHNIPVIFYSATFLEPEDEALAKAVGASGFIHKDSEPETFRRQLRNVLDVTRDNPVMAIQPTQMDREALSRQHQATLIAKLNKKVSELETEKQALRENQLFLDHIVRTIPDVVFVLKVPGLEPSYVAPEAEHRLIGYSADDVMGSVERWIALVHEEDRQRVVEELQAIIESRTSGIIVIRMYHKEGGYRWVESRVSPKVNEQGEVVELVGSLSDITQRRDAEEKLKKSERRLQRLFKNLPGMAYRCDNAHDWNMQFLSDGVMELTGYTRDEVEESKAVSFADIIHPDDRQRVWDEVQQAINESRQFSLTYRIMHKDGSIRWVWERGVAVMGDNTPTIQLEGFINDITLRKQAEEKLLASEQRFRSLFEMMESGLSIQELMYDENGKACDYRFIDVNPAYEQMSGLKASEIIGRSAREVLPWFETEWLDDYVRVEQSGEVVNFIRDVTALGRSFDVVVYQTLPGQFASIITDITEQRAAEENIRNLARFPEENPSPVLRINSSGELVYCNPAGKCLLEYCEARGEKPICKEFLEAAQKAISDGSIRRMDYSMGDSYFAFVVSPVPESGYANLYGRDVTKRVLATQQLEKVNRVLRTLSKGNRSLVHATSEQELLDTVCEILSSDGGYPYVWAAYYEAGRHFVPQAGRGAHADLMQQWLDDLSAVELRESILGDFLRDDKPTLLSDLSAEKWSKKQRNTMHESGYSALLLLPIQHRDSHIGVIGIFSESEGVFDQGELDLLNEMASDVAYGIQALRIQNAHEKGMQRIQSTMLQTIEAVSLTLEKRDPYTAGHQHRVVQLAVAIAAAMGLEEQRIEGLMLAALVHDIGKIHIPAEILNRPGRLSETEFGIIKSHPQVGYDILKGVEFDWPIAEMVLQHHERIDGTGYPEGLKGEEILLEARIIGVADVVEAITSHRPYRPGLGVDIALHEIEDGRGSRYDVAVVDTCLHLFREEGFSWSDEFNLFADHEAGTVRPFAH